MGWLEKFLLVMLVEMTPARVRSQWIKEVFQRFFFLIPAGFIVLTDQLSKAWCLHHLELSYSSPFIDHLVFLTLTFNNRGAFSLFPFSNAVFIATTGFLLAGISVYAACRMRGSVSHGLVGLIVGGGAGNLIDRLRFGHVVDFIDLRWWPVFNVADSAISVAATALLALTFFGRGSDGLLSKEKRD